ncbi:MAG: hypothetical protein ACOX7U_00130 [Desulfitobacteriia bacterium]|jgi:anti-sigma factor RsiW
MNDIEKRLKGLHCYKPQDWYLYQEGSLPSTTSRAMEEHLLDCESCLNVYLTALEESLGNLKKPELNRDFTDRVMSLLEREFPAPRQESAVEKRRKVPSINLIIGYCAAASIALFFWVGGYFGEISDSLVKGINAPNEQRIEQREPSRKSLIRAGWTEQTRTEKPSTFIKTILKKE